MAKDGTGYKRMVSVSGYFLSGLALAIIAFFPFRGAQATSGLSVIEKAHITRYTFNGMTPPAGAFGEDGNNQSGIVLVGFCTSCFLGLRRQHDITRKHFDDELQATQDWIVTVFFRQNILPALMMMTEQLTAVAMQQVEIIGMFLDAKHQLETQRLFQQLQAQAHKDYHPSEGMCTIGTNIRSIALAERNSDLSMVAVSNRTMQRQLLSGKGSGFEGPPSDAKSRLEQFRVTFCNPRDNNNGFGLLCPNPAPAEQQNKDVDYTRTIEAPLTLTLDITNDGNPDHTPKGLSRDEEDVFALAANLYASETLPVVKDTHLSNQQVRRETGDNLYLALRSVAAKRSVAQNSFAAIAGMKTAGTPLSDTEGVKPFLFNVVKELGLSDAEVEKLLGKRPSYFAQMEVMTKKLYQNPNFYTDLYDKPANVDRKEAALQAIGLMQDRDIYRSLLRSEAIMSVLLEMKLIEEQERVNSKLKPKPAPAEQR